MKKEDIDNICWFIPFRSLRHSIRSLFNDINSKQLFHQNLLFLNLNKLKESDLKEKIKNGKKVKVFFFINRSSQFGLDLVYNLMSKNNYFEPYIFVANARDLLFEEDNEIWHEFLDDYNFFKNQGYNTIPAYDLETKKPNLLDKFNPDIVFFNDPWITGYTSIFHNMNINIKYLTCYNNYGFNVVKSVESHYRKESINNTWKIFAENMFEYSNFLNSKQVYSHNVILSGRAKLDLYKKNKNECIIPEKIDNGKKIVIIAPHWTVFRKNEPFMQLKSTFNLYYKYFMNLLKKYKDINFVFKPHPNLLHRIRETNIIDYNEYLNYLEEWDNSDNGICITSGEYIDLFIKSSCLITDSGSFIAEYLPSKNPCIYLLHPDYPNMLETTFESFANKILNTYYLTYSEEDVDKYFRRILIDNIDDKKNDRLKVLKEEFVNIGNASEIIFNNIKESLDINE